MDILDGSLRLTQSLPSEVAHGAGYMGSEQAAAATDPNRATGTKGQPSGPEAAEETERLIAADLTRFKCIRNAAYHEDRERHFVRLQKLCMFVVVLFGTAAFGAIAARSGAWRPGFPVDGDHHFQWMTTTCSG
jgi:hypothetical protein